MIKAVVFDWGGVLIYNPAPVYLRYLAEYFHVEEEEFKRILRGYEHDFQTTRISEQVLWEQVCTALQIPQPSLPDSLWKKAFSRAYAENPDVFSLATDLKKMGYFIGLLSNTELPAVDYFYEKKYVVFDGIMFSCLEGVRKPDPEIFHRFLKRFQLQAAEMVFIDDNESNIATADNLGIQTVLFTDINQCKQKLQSLQITL